MFAKLLRSVIKGVYRVVRPFLLLAVIATCPHARKVRLMVGSGQYLTFSEHCGRLIEYRPNGVRDEHHELMKTLTGVDPSLN